MIVKIFNINSPTLLRRGNLHISLKPAKQDAKTSLKKERKFVLFVPENKKNINVDRIFKEPSFLKCNINFKRDECYKGRKHIAKMYVCLIQLNKIFLRSIMRGSFCSLILILHLIEYET